MPTTAVSPCCCCSLCPSPRPNEFPRNGVSAERGAQVLEGEAIDTTAAVFQQINHPSVVQWGYANEEYVNATWSKSLHQYEGIVRSLDPSRPVHAANPIPYAQRHGPYNLYAHRDQSGAVCNVYQTYNWGMGGEGTSSGSPCGYTEGTGQIATGPAWPYEWDEVGAAACAGLAVAALGQLGVGGSRGRAVALLPAVVHRDLR